MLGNKSGLRLENLIDEAAYALSKRMRCGNYEYVFFETVSFKYFRSDKRGQTLRNK